MENVCPTERPADAPTRALFCKDDEFFGTCMTMAEDVPNLSKTEIGNDTASSGSVLAGTRVTLTETSITAARAPRL